MHLRWIGKPSCQHRPDVGGFDIIINCVLQRIPQKKQPNMTRAQSPSNNVSTLHPGNNGIEVQEEALVLIKAQLMYRLRCECGRCWFDIQLPRLAACPACRRKGMVLA
jgi:hypothetical protein